ncbi:MAG: cytochrome c [Gammaproteobacteria bacterium]|nr:cytochrome c [Gammaproteobacteria bacterium]MBT3860075.1 cytochrome c [Gammaproteobacteria bacterium]MBT3987367.1 cytochrome c [Gammaproteobacteria bacterium]MBT4257329.1 cytochrome c [Gammaproteobacteria bacterium]MBT4581895.1 cytochrome c [Gammaproteobacteria bacterium]
MSKRVIAVLTAFTILISGAMLTASAQDAPTPEEQAAAAVDTRKSLFKLFIHNLRPIAAMAQGAPFNAEIAERNARRIAAMAPMIPELLAHDTRGFDVETTALDKIWDNQDDIAAKAQALVDNANAFAAAAATGEMGATLGAFRAFGGSCGNCHDEYRVDND